MPTPSLNQITTVLASHFDREQDEPFKRMLGLPVDAWRSVLISRSLDKHPNQRSIYRQRIFVPMVSASQQDCSINIGLCPVSKSAVPIPKPLRSSILFDYVGSVDGSNAFELAVTGTSNYLKAGRWAKRNVQYDFSNNNEIFIDSTSKLPMILIDAVFDSPRDAMAYNCQYAGQDCDWWNKPYPATNDIIQMIIQYIIQVDYQRLNVPTSPEVEVNALMPKNKPEG